MPARLTGIIQVREPGISNPGKVLRSLARLIRGLDAVRIVQRQGLITVQFDDRQATLAEIVRVIEDCGPRVSGVAQRRANSER